MRYISVVCYMQFILKLCCYRIWEIIDMSAQLQEHFDLDL